MKRKTVIIIGWLVFWQLLALWVDNEILLAGPLDTLRALVGLLPSLTFWQTIVYSLARIGAGFVLGVGVGLLLACTSARFSMMEEVLAPLMSLLKAIPVASFVVLFLIWWRSGVLPAAISFCVVLPQIYISTLEGLRSTDERLLEMARVFHMSGKDRFFYLYLPALKPFLDSSLRIVTGLSWKSGVAAEVIGTPIYSIGERLYLSKIYLDTADVLAWTAVTIFLSVLSERFVLALWERFCQWTPACSGAKQIPHDTGEIVLDGVSKSYHGREVIAPLTVRYGAGETAYFRTPSGSGKTTLFRLIAGLEQPDGGMVTRHGSVAYVFQEDRLCEEYSAVQNVALVTGDEALAREHLLELLDESALALPCRELSGGMKRRVALARAFASQGEILLLDEPFTGMDAATQERVQAYMEHRRRGRTLLIATHTPPKC